MPVADTAVRSYRPEDEERVRRICYDTALYGQPLESLVSDFRLATDIYMLYYLRYEPESLFVAEVEGRVVAYLAGCLDTARFEAIYRRRIGPRLILNFLARGHWRRRQSWRLVFGGVRHHQVWGRYHDLLRDGYPAHLHINVDACCREHHLGARLLEAFLALARNREIPGVHISTSSERAMTFFQRGGFGIIATGHTVSVADGSQVPMWLMGLKLAATNAAPGAPA